MASTGWHGGCYPCVYRGVKYKKQVGLIGKMTWGTKYTSRVERYNQLSFMFCINHVLKHISVICYTFINLFLVLV
jgi:hypothetical protein